MFNQLLSKLNQKTELNKEINKSESSTDNSGEFSDCRLDLTSPIAVLRPENNAFPTTPTARKKHVRNSVSPPETTAKSDLKRQRNQRESQDLSELNQSAVKSTMGDNIEAIINKAIQATENRMTVLIKNEMQPIHEFISSLKVLNSDVKVVKTEIQIIKENERRKNIVVYGIKENPNENYFERDKIIENLATTLKIPTLDYDDSFRLGKFSPDNPRPLLIKLLRQRDKQTVMRNWGNLKGTPITIRDDLTPLEKKANFELRKKKSEILLSYPRANVKIKNGKLFVRDGDKQLTFQYDESSNEVNELVKPGPPMQS